MLRNEWGFKGHVVTDYAGTPGFQNSVLAVTARNFMLSTNATNRTQFDGYDKDPYVVSMMRETCHDILYSGVNSAAMNGVDQNTRVVKITPTWIYWLVTLDVVVGVLLLAGAGLITWLNFFKKSKKA